MLQAFAGLVLTVPLAILVATLWPRLEREAMATKLLVWSGLGARAAV
jgi:glycopeptide antibiotics resistance protein